MGILSFQEDKNIGIVVLSLEVGYYSDHRDLAHKDQQILELQMALWVDDKTKMDLQCNPDYKYNLEYGLQFDNWR